MTRLLKIVVAAVLIVLSLAASGVGNLGVSSWQTNDFSLHKIRIKSISKPFVISQNIHPTIAGQEKFTEIGLEVLYFEYIPH